MRKGFLTSIAALLASGGLALAGQPVVQISFDDGDGASHVVRAGGGPVASSAPAPIVESGAPIMMQGGDIGPAGGCCPPGDVWFDAAYLMWWIKDAHVPILATTGPTTGGGLLGAPGTRVVLGGGDVDDETFSGGRFGGGLWLDDCHTIGLEADYLFLGQRNFNFNAGANGSANSILLARPFYDIAINQQNSDIFALPGEAKGEIDAHMQTFLQGAETNLLLNVCNGCCSRVDLLGGFRWMQLRDSLDIHEQATVICNCPNPFPATSGNTIDTFDLYGARNNFYGGNIGAQAEFCRGKFFLRVLGQVALGDSHEEATINGSTLVTTAAGAQTVRSAGLLAVNGNICDYHRDRFAVIPEVGLTLGYQVTCHLRVFVGYSFLYWSDVLRAGDQVVLVSNSFRAGSSTVYNPNAAPAPSYAFHGTDFWAQGINFGIEFRY